jgi:hypothetical protein
VRIIGFDGGVTQISEFGRETKWVKINGLDLVGLDN